MWKNNLLVTRTIVLGRLVSSAALGSIVLIYFKSHRKTTGDELCIDFFFNLWFA